MRRLDARHCLFRTAENNTRHTQGARGTRINIGSWARAVVSLSLPARTMAADPAVTDRIRTDVENKFGRWKAWCKQHGTTRFTGSYKNVDPSAQPVQLKANSFGELRRALRAVKVRRSPSSSRSIGSQNLMHSMRRANLPRSNFCACLVSFSSPLAIRE